MRRTSCVVQCIEHHAQYIMHSTVHSTSCAVHHGLMMCTAERARRGCDKCNHLTTGVASVTTTLRILCSSFCKHHTNRAATSHKQSSNITHTSHTHHTNRAATRAHTHTCAHTHLYLHLSLPPVRHTHLRWTAFRSLSRCCGWPCR